jgi:drug/metabolite transporter (DMT)-like permease
MMGEVLTGMNLLGMGLVLGGVSLVVLKKETENGKKQLRYPLKGILLALGGAIGQG